MPSPFPGMDPFVESAGLWPDFHLGMLAALRSRLNRQLPPGLVAQAEVHVWLHEPVAERRQAIGRADLAVTRQTVPAGNGIATAPQTVILPVVPRVGSCYLRVVDARERRVVTVIELLSPSNKTPGADRDSYLAKRHEYLTDGVSLVEIDLLRNGPRLPVGAAAVADYYLLVCRAWEQPQADVWSLTVRDALPPLPVPLGATRSAVFVDLTACFAEVYDGGGYSRTLDYTRPPVPALSADDAAWADALIHSATP